MQDIGRLIADITGDSREATFLYQRLCRGVTQSHSFSVRLVRRGTYLRSA